MNFKKISTLLRILTLVLLSQYVIAQGTIKGIVTSEEEPDGLPNATVMVGEIGTVTELDGSFTLEIPAGEHTVIVGYTGYDDYTKTFTIADGETQEINVVLEYGEVNILETATVTSGKFDKPLGEVTVSMEVIQPELAETTNSTTVDEVLDKVPGVTIIDGQANIRGGSGFSYGAGSRVLLLVDDIPILAGDAGYPNWTDVPVENIEQIEVVKGAASALYGSSALNGIINIRTAYAKNEPETNFAMYNETFFRPKDSIKHWWKPDNVPTPMKVGASLVHRQKFKNIDWVFGTTGYLDYSYIQNARDNKIRLTNKLRYRVNENLNVGFYTNFNAGSSNTVFLWVNENEGAYVGDVDNMTNSKTKRFNIDPFVNYYDKKGNRHKYMGRYFSTNNDNANNQGNFSDLFYNEYQFQRQFEELDLVFTTGVVATNTLVQGTLYGDTTYVATNYALYVQGDKKFYFSKDAEGNKVENKNILNISVGARNEYNALDGPSVVNGDFLGDGKESESKPVFRVGLNYRPAEFTYIRASWGQGYRYPTIAEKYITTNVGGLNILPNPTLESETGWSSEIGIKQGFQVANFQGFVDISGFWTEYQNMMEFNFALDPNSILGFGFKSQNVGATVINGTEITVAGGTNPKKSRFPTNVLIGYTYINPKFKLFEEVPPGTSSTDIGMLSEGQLNNFFSTSSENILKYRSQHTLKLDVETKLKMMTFGVSLIGGSKVDAIDTILNNLFGINNYRAENDGAYWVFGARMGYHINDQVKVSVVGKNLTNREYSLRPGQLEPPMSFSLRVDAKF